MDAERWNRLHPGKQAKVPYVTKMLKDEEGVFVAASDYVNELSDSISKWFPRKLHSLGTNGFGRSESRAGLRDFFEVDAKHIVVAVLFALVEEGKIKNTVAEKAIKDYNINPDTPSQIYR